MFNIFKKKPPTTTVTPTEDRGILFDSNRLTKKEIAEFKEAEKKENKEEEEEQRTDLVSYNDANAYQQRYGFGGGGKKSKSKKSKKRKTKKSKKRKSKRRK